MNLTKFSRATIYKLRKNLFPDSISNKNLSVETKQILKKWKNKEISTKDCIRLTGYSRTYLYKLITKEV